ncbi:MAG: hypothetical protein K2N10_07120 [Muribaculaceae bacterium]|nr:hypothetical protein [Muribaculaceae bacterium]
MINELLEKFYNGETTLKEEQLMLDLLERNPDPNREADLRLLRALNAPMPDFDEMIFNAKGMSPEVKPRRLRWLLRFEAAAAAVIFFVAAGSYFFGSAPAVMNQRELTVDESREQAIWAITALSDGVNRSLNQLEKLNNL